MGRKKTAGLVKRNGIWHIDKIIAGHRVCQSCGTSDLNEAEQFLHHLIEEKRQAKIHGVRPKRTFEEAAIAYIQISSDKKSIRSEISKLQQIIPAIGDLNIDSINRRKLDSWVKQRRKQGRSINTINHGLKMVRRVLNVAATELYDEHDMTWLETAPKIKLLKVTDEKEPYPIDWSQQAALLAQLPPHLKDMALFILNTGCRDQEVCQLRWEWEREIPEYNTSVFYLPSRMTKNSTNRVIVLNSISREIIERQRGKHPDFVFSYRGKGLYQMNNSGWRKAREKADLAMLRVHDLRHTFATRLCDLGVPYEDVKAILGHAKSVTTDGYIHATYSRFQKAVDKLCPNVYGKYPKIALFRLPEEIKTRIIPADKKKGSAK